MNYIHLSIYIFITVVLTICVVYNYKKYKEALNEYKELKDIFRHTRNENERLQRTNNNLWAQLNGANIEKFVSDKDANSLLWLVHDAYSIRGDQKKFKDLMVEIGELKNKKIKNSPKINELRDLRSILWNMNY